MAGCCLLLAAKVNDPKERDYNTLLDCVDRVLDVSAKEVYTNEFSIYAALEFSLFVPAWEISSHIERILVKSAFKLCRFSCPVLTAL